MSRRTRLGAWFAAISIALALGSWATAGATSLAAIALAVRAFMLGRRWHSIVAVALSVAGFWLWVLGWIAYMTEPAGAVAIEEHPVVGGVLLGAVATGLGTLAWIVAERLQRRPVAVSEGSLRGTA